MPAKKLTVALKKRVITVSLSPDLIRRLDIMAKRDDRSRSYVVESLVRRCVERQAA